MLLCFIGERGEERERRGEREERERREVEKEKRERFFLSLSFLFLSPFSGG